MNPVPKASGKLYHARVGLSYVIIICMEPMRGERGSTEVGECALGKNYNMFSIIGTNVTGIFSITRTLFLSDPQRDKNLHS